jgi:hypothetical protein
VRLAADGVLVGGVLVLARVQRTRSGWRCSGDVRASGSVRAWTMRSRMLGWMSSVSIWGGVDPGCFAGLVVIGGGLSVER